jgi:hypothetical protein
LQGSPELRHGYRAEAPVVFRRGEVSDLYRYTDGLEPSSESNLKLIFDVSRIYYLSENCLCGTRELNYWDHGASKPHHSRRTIPALVRRRRSK